MPAVDHPPAKDPEPEIPQTLYKYVRRDGLRLLEEKRLRIPSPIGFNDPFEILPGFEALMPADRLASLLSQTLGGDGIEELYEETARERGVSSSEIRRELPPDQFRDRFESEGLGGIVEDLAPGLYRVVQKAISEHLGIVCFTDKPDSLLMWGHYAEGHRGFVYGFDPRHPFFESGESPDGHRLFRKVVYSRRRPESCCRTRAIRAPSSPSAWPTSSSSPRARTGHTSRSGGWYCRWIPPKGRMRSPTCGSPKGS